MQPPCGSVEDYERIGTISEGTYGVVYKARHKDSGKVVALKKIKLVHSSASVGFPPSALREISILLSMRHPNIVLLDQIVVGSSLSAVYMVMEYMQHELKTLMQTKSEPFAPAEVKCLVLQLLRGVEALHEQWIVHRDLKTSNLLLDNEGTLKICDLGLGRKVGSPLGSYTQPVVTLWYRAPELLLGEKSYSFAVDMWSVGCIFAELVLKRPLFEGANGEIELVNKIFQTLATPNESCWKGYSKLPFVKKFAWKVYPKNKLPELFSNAVSPLGIDLLSRLLTYDPEQRISAKEALKHAWFQEYPPPLDPRLISLTLPKQFAGSSHALR
jgi:cell division cycle 2-like protein